MLHLLHTNGASAPQSAPVGIEAEWPDDLASITVNRDPNGVDPFAPILVTPTHSVNSGTPSGFAVELADAVEPTGYRHVGTVSESYLLLPNRQVRDLALEIADQTNMAYRESGLFWDGKRMMHTVDLLGHTEAVEPGDDHALRLVTMTSYDKSWRYSCRLGAVRFQCTNGTVAGEFFASCSFKHVYGVEAGGAWADVVRQAMSVIDRAPEDLDRFVTAMRVLKRARVTDGRLRDVWKALPSLGDSIKGRIMSRYVEHEEPTLYGVYNAGTAALSKRGEKTTAADIGHLDAFCSAMLDIAGRMN